MTNWRYWVKLAAIVTEFLPNKEDNLFNKVFKMISVGDAIHDELYGSRPAEHTIAKVVNNRPVKMLTSPIFTAMFHRYNLGVNLKRQVTVISSDREIWSYELDGELICLLATPLSANLDVGTGTGIFNGLFWFTQNFPMQKLFTRLWSHFPDGVKIEMKSGPHGNVYRLVPLDSKPVKLTPQSEAVLERLLRVPSRRTYLALGTYGTGKTTLMRELARRRGERCLRFTVEALQGMGDEEALFFIDLLKPDFVIVDDFDRLTERYRIALLLEMFEAFQGPDKPTLAITVNHTKRIDAAILRAGRIDEVIDFEPPGKEERLWLLNERLPAKVTSEERERLLEITAGFTTAEVINLCQNCEIQLVNEAIHTTQRLRKLLEGREEPTEDGLDGNYNSTPDGVESAPGAPFSGGPRRRFNNRKGSKLKRRKAY